MEPLETGLNFIHPEVQRVYFEEIFYDKHFAFSKRIIPEEYTSYHYYHTKYPGLSDSEEYAKSNYDGWFYAD